MAPAASLLVGAVAEGQLVAEPEVAMPAGGVPEVAMPAGALALAAAAERAPGVAIAQRVPGGAASVVAVADAEPA
ncbi:hypothetical protein MHX63_09800 [Corynebacterium sp. ACRQK]|nr:hypothetical protein [Corynebacterium sp. ACRQK]